MDKKLISFEKQVEKHLKHAETFVNVEPKEVVRIYDNLMRYGVSVILICRYFLKKLEENDDKEFLEDITNAIGEYKKFSIEIEVDGISVLTTNGYTIGRIGIFTTEPMWLEVDEDFSIKKYREFIKNLLFTNVRG